MTLTQSHIQTIHQLYKRLAGLIQGYRTMNDDQRLSESTVIFDALKHFLREFRTLQDLKAVEQNGLAHRLVDYREAHDTLLATYQKAVMMHVDEPHGEYLVSMQRLQQYLAPFLQTEYRAVIAGIESGLDEDQAAMLQQQLNKITASESHTVAV
ncbi:MAG: hypothetical protein AB7P76_09755 [Candidatus Melainabacteria bacterium]